jgi:hypothetical protein
VFTELHAFQAARGQMPGVRFMLISAFFVGFSDLFFYWWCFAALSFDDWL